MADITVKIVRRPMNAYRQPRKIYEGCQHQLGCKCDPPYWLRESSPQEKKIEKGMKSRGGREP